MIPTVALAMRAAFGPSPGSLLSCCLLFALWLPIGSAAANEVTDWSVIIEQTAIASSVKPGVILSGRNVSLMHLAMHDTLNSISRRHDSYGVHRSSPDANPRAAVMAAGHGVAVRLYPDQASSLDNLYSKMLLTIPDEPGKNEGLGGALTPAGRMGLELPGGASPPAFGTNNAYAATGRAAASSCAQLYHSDDPATGTFLGYDGRRHACT